MNENLKKYFSYVFPLTKKIPSEFSGNLEITWYNGKKYLNTKNANYSYGSLQKILHFGLEKISLKNYNSILILGMGGGSVIQTLRNDFHFKKKITTLDIDPKIIEIAKSEFGIHENENLEILCEDAFHFVEKKLIFDGIIIDLFIDSNVPEKFYKKDFWKNVMKNISKNGFIIFNASLENTIQNELENIQKLLEENGFQISIFEKVENTNTLVLALKNE
ncbi:spermidine synthase [Aureivirga marina]|uniref:spermidine synthase n=1 Tax=Aureivirga marina TaxID=1182451 RepID=UPI001E38EF55|nr:fused MFS/spermidine synthase [Aureivirga marina]